MAVRKANAHWKGSITEGSGQVKLGSGAFEGQYSFSSRFEEGTGTNPEELIGAAHAGCLAMAFSGTLGRAGYTPEYVNVSAKVHLNKTGDGFAINKIELILEASVPDIEDDEFQELATKSKETCPVSMAYASIDEITLDAKLV